MTAIHGAAPPAYLNPPVLDQGTQPAVPYLDRAHPAVPGLDHSASQELTGHSRSQLKVVGKSLCTTAADRVEIRAEGGCNHHSMSPHTRRNQKPGGRFPSFPADKDASVATFLAHETRPPAGAIIPCRLRAPLPPLGYPPLCLGSQGGAAR